MSKMPDEFCVYSVTISLPKDLCELVKKFNDGCPDPVKPIMAKVMDECGLGLIDNILSRFPEHVVPGETCEGLQIQFYGNPQDALLHLEKLSTALQMCILPDVFLHEKPMAFPHFFLKAGSPWCRVDLIVLKEAPPEVKQGGDHARNFMKFVQEHRDRVLCIPVYISLDDKAADADVLHLIRQMDSTAQEFETEMQHVFAKDFKPGGIVH